MILIICTIANTYIALSKLTHFIHTTLRVRSSYYFNFINKEMENTERFSNLLKVTNQRKLETSSPAQNPCADLLLSTNSGCSNPYC